MASLSRENRILAFKTEIARFTEGWSKNHYVYYRPMVTTHIQMASVDEMMAAFGYLPRTTDGRWGYVAINRNSIPSSFLGREISFENAVRMHNGNLEWMSKRNQKRLNRCVNFARDNRIVEKVSLQKRKRGIKAQTLWVKFLPLGEK